VKRIKANQRGAECELLPAWRAATLALDVNAGLLASHSPNFELSSCVAHIAAALDSGKIPIFAPATALFGSLWFQPNWTVTTDTMGLHFAHLLGARRYVIVTDVDGVFESEPRPDVNARLMARISVGKLEKLSSSKLDAAFPAYFRRHPISTTIVNGKHPDRVCDAVWGRRVVGTQVMIEIEPLLNGHNLDRVTALPSVAMAAHSS
jgi:aspartokinase-like uncharacterized kinase